MNKGRSDDRPRPGLPQRPPLSLHPLLDFLATQGPVDAVQWHQWRLTRLVGGANNLLYRASSDQGQFAVKFTLRDARDRAGREYHALVALQRAGLDLAPQPVLLERERYPQPVVVTTWLAGQSADIPPADDAEWDGLIRHLVTVHALTPAETTVALPPVVLTMASAQDGLVRLDDQLRRLPEEARPAALRALADRAAHAPFPAWPQPPVALCRGDPNISNFLRRPGTWASVDWEYSGWGDPAFEIADLATHPKYDAVPSGALGLGHRALLRRTVRSHGRDAHPRLRPADAGLVGGALRPPALRGTPRPGRAPGDASSGMGIHRPATVPALPRARRGCAHLGRALALIR